MSAGAPPWLGLCARRARRERPQRFELEPQLAYEGLLANELLEHLEAGVVVLELLRDLVGRVVVGLVHKRRIVLDPRRGASYLAMLITGIGMFGVFLFLTYYLQLTLGFSPVQTGLAFLPMTGAVVITSTASTVALLPRIGPRPLVTLGMGLSALGMILLTRLGVDSTYTPQVLVPLLIIGAGLGLTFAPAMSTATLGVDRKDAGVASALVNTMQQVGGSLGTALLSTLAASATTSYLHGKAPTPDVISHATVHGYTVAFWIAAGVFALGAVVCSALFPRGVVEVDPNAEPVLAH